MVKILALIGIFFLTVLMSGSGWAQCTEGNPCPELARLMVGMGGVPAAGAATEEETCASPCIFSASWDGDDILGTNAGTGHVWDSVTEPFTPDRLTHGTTADTGWNDEDHYLDWSGTSSDSAQVIYAFSDADAIGLRFAIYLTSESLADDNSMDFYLIQYSGSNRIYGRYKQTAGPVYSIEIGVLNSADGITSVGTVAVSLATWYQVIIKWQKNTAGGCVFEVWDEAGSSQIGTTQTLDGGVTTKNTPINTLWIGQPLAWGSTWVIAAHRMDVVRLQNTYAFPGLRTP